MTIEAFKNYSLTSKRLKIIPLDESHNFFIFELLNSNGWKSNIGDRNIKTHEDATKYIQKIKSLPETVYWVVTNLENNTPIGIITLMKRLNFDFYDLGYAFMDAFMGQGYAFEASKTLIQFLKLDSKIETLIAITIIKNLKSVQLLEKLSFILEKEYTENHEQLYLYKLELQNIKI
jgi:[ribosomal protein S5]-alanine N-acetyltransferase